MPRDEAAKRWRRTAALLAEATKPKPPPEPVPGQLDLFNDEEEAD